MRYSRDDLEGFRNRRLRMFKDDWLSDLIKSFNNKAQARMSQQLKVCFYAIRDSIICYLV